MQSKPFNLRVGGQGRSGKGRGRAGQGRAHVTMNTTSAVASPQASISSTFTNLKFSLSSLSHQRDGNSSVPPTGQSHPCPVDRTKPCVSCQQNRGLCPIDRRVMALSCQREREIHGGRSICSAVGSHTHVTYLSRQQDGCLPIQPSILHT